MVCNALLNEKNEPVGFVCSAPWGMGITDYGDENGPEYRYIYGFSTGGDPHDFEPDFESNMPSEIAAWKAAKANCKCGREALAATETKEEG